MEKLPFHLGTVPPERHSSPNLKLEQSNSPGHPSPVDTPPAESAALPPNYDPAIGLGESGRRGPVGGGGVKTTGLRFTKP